MIATKEASPAAFRGNKYAASISRVPNWANCKAGQCPVTPPTPMSGPASTASWFLEQVFGQALSTTRLIVIHDKTAGTARSFASPSDAASYAIAAGENGNVYAGLALRQSGTPNSAGGIADVTALTCIGFEVDAKKNMTIPRNSCVGRLRDAAKFLGDCPLAPSIVVSSGHRLQPYWLFDMAWQVRSVTPRADATAFLHRWEATTRCYAQQRGWQVNPTSDLMGLIEIPGTMNRTVEADERATIAWPVNAGIPVRYRPEDIQGRFVEATKPMTGMFVAPPELSDATCVRLRVAYERGRGSLFAKLWNGQWSGEYPSWEASAVGLCMMLVYWLGPKPQLIAAAFKASGLYRLKWESPHYGTDQTYGEGVIRMAIARQREFYRMPHSGGSL